MMLPTAAVATDTGGTATAQVTEAVASTVTAEKVEEVEADTPEAPQEREAEEEVSTVTMEAAKLDAGQEQAEETTQTNEAETTAVASIDGESYTTLEAAITAANQATADVTITLSADVITEAAKGDVNKWVFNNKNINVTLDLNGHSILAGETETGNIRVAGAKLTVQDSKADAETKISTGKIYTETDYASGAGYGIIRVTDGGSFTLDSGYIYAVRPNAAYKGQYGVVARGENNNITINGGRIEAGWFAISGNGLDASGETKITVNGGTLISTTDFAIYHPHSGTMTINGGTIQGQTGGIAVRRGTVVVYGGTIISNGVANDVEWADGTTGMSSASINVDGNYGASSLTIYGGTLKAANSALELLTNAKYGATATIYGGTFSGEVSQDYLAAEAKIVTEDSVSYYATLTEAVAVANQADTQTTVTLCKDVEIVKLSLTGDIILDLNNHKITLPDTDSSEKRVWGIWVGGKATIKNGTISMERGNVTSSTYVIIVDYLANQAKIDETVSTLTTEDLTIQFNRSNQAKQCYGIYVQGTGDKLILDKGTKIQDVDVADTVYPAGEERLGIGVVFYGKECTVKDGVTIKTTGFAISGNGTKHGTTINIEGGTLTSTKSTAIYHPQNGTLDITGGTITGAETGIEIRAGKLTVSGENTVIRGNGTPVTVNANGSGTTSDGAGIAVAQHTTKLDLTVDIQGGTISGYSALYESNPQKNNADALAKITLTVTGGTLNAINGGTQAVYSEDVSGFITGGTFSTDVSSYCKSGYTAVQNSAGSYVVQEVKTVTADTNGSVTINSDAVTVNDKTPVAIQVNKAENGASNSTVTVAQEIVGAMKQNNTSSLKISTETAEIAFDQEAVKQITEKTQDLVLEVKETSKDDLPAVQQTAAQGAEKIIQVNLQTTSTDESGKTDKVEFNNGSATIRVGLSETQKKNAENYEIYYITDQGVRESMNAQYDNGYMSFTTPHFSTYVLAEKANFQLDIETDKTDYDAGDTITANIYLTASVQTSISAIQFALDYDSNLLSLDKLTTVDGTALKTNGIAKVNNEKFAAANSNQSIGADKVQIATATFKVLTSVEDGTSGSIAFATAIVGLTAGEEKAAPEANPVTVNLHNITVTLKPDDNSTLTGSAASITYYAKYSEAGLYTDIARKTIVEDTSDNAGATANSGYRLAKLNWTDGTDSPTNSLKDLTAIANVARTKSATYTLQTVKTYVVNVAKGDHGNITATETYPKTVDTGTTIGKLVLPTPTADPGYAFDGWYVDTTPVTNASKVEDLAGNSDSVTLTAKFVAKNYTLSGVSNGTIDLTNATVTIKGGLESDGSTITYGNAITFTVEPKDNKAINTVTYTVGSGTATAPTTAKATDGTITYTIPADAILGNISIQVSTIAYHTVTFKAGTGTVFEDSDGNKLAKQEITAYVLDGLPGLYKDVITKETFTVPTVKATTGYRLANKSGEFLWVGTKGSYAENGVENIIATEDVTLTATAKETVAVTFKVNAETSYGTLDGETEVIKTFDKNHVITAADLPTVAAKAGYTVDGWSANFDDAEIPVVATADTTYTLTFKNATYKVVFPEINGVTFGADTQPTHGTDFTFTMTVTNAQADVYSVSYQIGDNEPVALTAPNKDDQETTTYTYTIPGNEITDTVSILLDAKDVVTITFQVDSNGELDTYTKNYDVGTPLTEDNLPTPTGKDGYTFDTWTQNGYPVDFDTDNITATDPVVYTATFKDATYKVTGDVTGTATHGTDLVITPTSETDIYTGVKYTIKNVEKTLTVNKDTGTYTIPGSEIIGDITIEFVKLTSGKFTFVSFGKYMAMAYNKQLVILKNAGELKDDEAYALSGYGNLYYSDAYKGYVALVDQNEDAKTLSGKLYIATGSNTLVYDDNATKGRTGDVNGDGTIDAIDAGIVADLLEYRISNDAATYDLYRLRADVDGDYTVTTADIQLILEMAVADTTAPSDAS